MALSNIRNEPRRELTESAVGTFLFFGLLALFYWPGYYVALWEAGGQYNADFWFTFILGPVAFATALAIAIVVLSFIVYGFLQFTHGLGEIACDLLDSLGLRLRPRNRPGRVDLENLFVAGPVEVSPGRVLRQYSGGGGIPGPSSVGRPGSVSWDCYGGGGGS